MKDEKTCQMSSWFGFQVLNDALEVKETKKPAARHQNQLSRVWEASTESISCGTLLVCSD